MYVCVCVCVRVCVQALFDFIDTQEQNAGLKPNTYRLVNSYPRKVGPCPYKDVRTIRVRCRPLVSNQQHGTEQQGGMR